jgi:hypothetical protein
MTAFNRDKLKKILQHRIVKAYEDRVIKTKDIHRNTLDPFSAVLDAKLLNKDIQSWISDVEIPRQNQKSVQNALGSIHQEILGTVENWDDLKTGGVVDLKNDSKKIIAEIKNKHNTTKGNHKKEVYDDLESLINGDYKGYTGYYVEILPKNGKIYNEEFTPSDNVSKKRRPSNQKIKIIDGKSFYALVTGKDDALEQFYDEFPILIDEILKENFDDYLSIELGDMRVKLFEKIFPKTD